MSERQTGRERQPAKRVSVVSLRMVKESSFLYPQRSVRCPADAAEVVGRFLEGRDREHFVVLCLDTKRQPVAVHVASVGGLNAAIVHPREVFKAAVLSNSSAVIVAHNHPSGVTDPSQEDLDVTARLRDAGRIIGIEVLDHLIVGEGGEFRSLRESGWK